ncbi:MAG: hypothetical protein ABEI52_00475, partial [Halobacteriaceae archaeon]
MITAFLGAMVVLFAGFSKLHTTDTGPENPETTREAWQNAPVTTQSTIAPHDELDSRSLGDTTSRPLSGTVTSNENSETETGNQDEPGESMSFESQSSNEEEADGRWELPAESPINTDGPTGGDVSLDFSDFSYDWVCETGVRMADVGGMDEVKTE